MCILFKGILGPVLQRLSFTGSEFSREDSLPTHPIPHPSTFFSPHPALGCHRSPHPSLAVRLFLTEIITDCSRQKDLPGPHRAWKTGRPGARLSRAAICPGVGRKGPAWQALVRVREAAGGGNSYAGSWAFIREAAGAGHVPKLFSVQCGQGHK